MPNPIKIGLLDSGVSVDASPYVIAARGFALDEDAGVVTCPVQADPINHGSALARILMTAAPNARLVNAQAFTQSNVTSPVVIAAGLDWLVSQGVDIVNMSLGLRQKRPVLRDACANALAAGVVLVAAAPARSAVYPSAYNGVLRVTGDARCELREFSYLATEQADFGACPRSYEHSEKGAPVGGASFAVAHVVGVLANYLAAGGERGAVEAYLRRVARYHGPERRRS